MALRMLYGTGLRMHMWHVHMWLRVRRGGTRSQRFICLPLLFSPGNEGPANKISSFRMRSARGKESNSYSFSHQKIHLDLIKRSNKSIVVLMRSLVLQENVPVFGLKSWKALQLYSTIWVTALLKKKHRRKKKQQQQNNSNTTTPMAA